tara:strand:- start:57 stop:716 length:660 start_codon:yes stop_codon:yes gene_type:complete
MKFIITVFYLLFLSNIALSETALDYFRSEKGSLDKHFKCKMDNQKDNIEEFGFRKINNNLFVYKWWKEQKSYDVPYSVVKSFKSKIQGKNFEVFLFFEPGDPTMPTGSFIKLNVFATTSKGAKYFPYYQYWIDNSENDKTEGNITKNDIYDDWANMFNDTDEETFDQDLKNWTDKTYNFLKKKLDFGEPFEIIDLEVVPWEKVLAKYNGNPVFFTYKCK